MREFPTSTGPIDYALFVEGKPVGVVEATATDAVTILLLFRSQFRCSAEFHGACKLVRYVFGYLKKESF